MSDINLKKEFEYSEFENFISNFMTTLESIDKTSSIDTHSEDKISPDEIGPVLSSTE